MSADEAEELLAQTLSGLHIRTLPLGGEDPGSDVVLDLAGRQVRLQLKYYSLIDGSRALQVLHDLDSGGHPKGAERVPIVVSDRIVEIAAGTTSPVAGTTSPVAREVTALEQA